MSSAADFHSQVASILEALANAAVAEICKVVDDGYAVVSLEMSRSQKENEFLRRKIRLLELQISRHRAERLRGTEGSVSGRCFPGVRLLQHRQGRDTPGGASLQSRTRFLNRASLVSQPPQKTPPVNLDQDPDQEVVTTTKAEPTEAEEDSDLLIVKVEGNVRLEDTSINNNNSTTSRDTSSATRARPSSDTEVQGFPLNTGSVLETEVDKDGGDLKASPLTKKQTPFRAKTQEHSLTEDRLLYSARTSQNAPATPASIAQQDPTSEPNVGQKPHQCDLCGRRFTQVHSLKRHRRVHTGEGPRFPCAHCGKQFSTSHNLKVHQSVHTGEKRFLCSTCGGSFSFLSCLIRHQALHAKKLEFK